MSHYFFSYLYDVKNICEYCCYMLPEVIFYQITNKNVQEQLILHNYTILPPISYDRYFDIIKRDCCSFYRIYCTLFDFILSNYDDISLKSFLLV